jgi:hypothetical protein
MITAFSTFFLMDDSYFGVILEVFNCQKCEKLRKKLLDFY